jgi:preprotein translocase subunit YajC
MMGLIKNLIEAVTQVAMAPAGDGSGGGGLVSMLILMGILVAIWYFLIIGPERKRRKQMQEMINQLKPGDKIVTVGGIHGTVSGLTEKTVILRIAEQVKIEISRQAVGTVISPESEVKTADKE